MYALYFLEAAQYVSWAAFSSLRVYALWKRWAWAALVLLLSVVPPVSSGVRLPFADVFAGALPYADCPTQVNMSDQLFLSHQHSVSRMALIVADVIVLGVTWAATRETYRSQDLLRRFGRTTTLSSVLYTNGAAFDSRLRVFQQPILTVECDPGGRRNLLRVSTQAARTVASAPRSGTHLNEPHSPSVLTTLNALYLAVILLEESLGSGAGGRMNLLAVFVKTTYDSFTTILVTRFLAHLRKAARPAMGSAISFGSGVWTDMSGAVGDSGTATLQWARVSEEVDR
ncbi:uncharacterized protein TRAVEDRAFT_53526 [Trametes versicolor FP-101664 SS1]|uniref:uncharacterized protein n=1 Tax=Trametes versicolor (strain FP-101664) TaxID=717944 RepID=UPI00046220C9|nr:uncharacterized protein TRAVEDRAFT_53526 [Trametes versicolor FP-101664 SS1]EIW53114.1 hypothetical protein TRAVEDRAFT_53526 [Trametes versicolor FP-101664 SS1]